MYTPSTIRIFIGDLFKWKSWRRPFKHSYNNVVYFMTKLLSPEKQKKYYDKMLYDSGRVGYEIFLFMFDLKKAIYVDERKITCPGLIIGAKQDKLIPVYVARKVAKMKPDFIAFEVPELIGTGKPISKERPESVKEFVGAVKEVSKHTVPLCGAGISTGEDVRAALGLGTEGVLVASAVVKAENPKTVLENFALAAK